MTAESPSVWHRIRAAFVAGVLVVVPVGLTVGVLWVMASTLDGLQPWMLYGERIPGLGILLVLTVTLLVGALAQNVVGRLVLHRLEAMVERLPVLNALYRLIKQVVEAAVAQGTQTVKEVVLVEWPRRGLYSLAFVTGEGFLRRADGVAMLNVFLPSTPNPTTGFYFMVPADEAVRTDLTVEDAAKLLMSAGLVGAPPPIHIDTPRGRLPLHTPAGAPSDDP